MPPYYLICKISRYLALKIEYAIYQFWRSGGEKQRIQQWMRGSHTQRVSQSSLLLVFAIVCQHENTSTKSVFLLCQHVYIFSALKCHSGNLHNLLSLANWQFYQIAFIDLHEPLAGIHLGILQTYIPYSFVNLNKSQVRVDGGSHMWALV